MPSGSLQIRSARPADVPAIRDLHARSLRQLGKGYYPRAALEAAIEAGTFQLSLLHAGHYQVATIDEQIVGCGGWLDGGVPAPKGISPPANRHGVGRGPAVIRAVYVDPDHARKGIGRQLMEAIEADAVAAGKSEAELLSTRMATRFYASLGYAMQGPLALTLPTGHMVEVSAMRKCLARTPTWRMAELCASRSLEGAVAA